MARTKKPVKIIYIVTRGKDISLLTANSEKDAWSIIANEAGINEETALTHYKIERLCTMTELVKSSGFAVKFQQSARGLTIVNKVAKK